MRYLIESESLILNSVFKKIKKILDEEGAKLISISENSFIKNFLVEQEMKEKWQKEKEEEIFFAGLFSIYL